MIVLRGQNKNLKETWIRYYIVKNLLVMEVFLLDNYRSRSWSRKRNSFLAPAPAPAKNYGSGRLWLRNTGSMAWDINHTKMFSACRLNSVRRYDLNTKSSTSMTNFPDGLYHHACVIYKNKVNLIESILHIDGELQVTNPSFPLQSYRSRTEFL